MAGPIVMQQLDEPGISGRTTNSICRSEWEKEQPRDVAQRGVQQQEKNTGAVAQQRVNSILRHSVLREKECEACETACQIALGPASDSDMHGCSGRFKAERQPTGHGLELFGQFPWRRFGGKKVAGTDSLRPRRSGENAMSVGTLVWTVFAAGTLTLR